MKLKAIFLISALVLCVVCVRCEPDSTGHKKAIAQNHNAQNSSVNVQDKDKNTADNEDEYYYMDLDELNRKLLENKESNVENNNKDDSVLLNSEKESNLIEQKAHEKGTTRSTELPKPQNSNLIEEKSDNKLDEHLNGNHTHTDEVKNKEDEEINTNQVVKFVVLIGVMIVVTAALVTLAVLVIRNRNKKSSSNQTQRKTRQIYHPVNQTDSNI